MQHPKKKEYCIVEFKVYVELKYLYLYPFSGSMVSCIYGCSNFQQTLLKSFCFCFFGVCVCERERERERERRGWGRRRGEGRRGEGR